MHTDPARLRRLWAVVLTIILARSVALGAEGPPGTGAPVAATLKPLRVLLVSGTQIRDDVVIDAGGDAERGDVVAIAALLKLWGVPFDLMRLDVHSMSLRDVVDRAGRARYGAILWAARQDAYPWQPQTYDVLVDAVAAGVSLVAVGDRIREPTIQRLLGITYQQTAAVCDPLVVNDAAHSHFVTRGLEGTTAPLGVREFVGPHVRVEEASVQTLATACGLPQLTVRTADAAGRTRAVWLGGPVTALAESPAFIALLRRALVYALGYALYKDYRDTVLLRMDDPGCAPSAYLRCTYPRWYYPELLQADWNTKVLPALRAHHARLGVFFCAGYPDPDHTRPPNTIVPSCGVDVPEWDVDCGGSPEPNPQRLTSTCAGLHDGVREDLIEIQSHGWTHMQPDLTGWWNGTGMSEWRVAGWYREFHDDVHGADVPAAVQRDRLSRAVAGITEEFGSPPSMFVPPGHSISGRDVTAAGPDVRVGTTGAPGPVHFEGPGTRMRVTLNGAQPRARYTVYVGDRRWTRLGAIVTDAQGNATTMLETPGLAASAGARFVVVKRGGTQFVAGPIAPALDGRRAWPFRARSEMTADEQARFRIARDPLAGGGIGDASVVVRISGAAANASYTIRFVGATTTDVGVVTTDAGGNGHTLLALPASVLGSRPGGYFTLERAGTQLVAGPTDRRLDMTVDLPFRDPVSMTAEERTRFPAAVDRLVAGGVNVTSYRPDRVAPTYTYALAAESGFGIADDDVGHYLGRDYVVTVPQIQYATAAVGDPKQHFFQRQLDVVQRHFDRHVPVVIYHHDADVRLDPEYYPRMLDRLATRWPDVAYLTPNEWSGYLHAGASAATAEDGIRFELRYDPTYGRYFAAHPSTWTLHLSDDILADLRARGTLDLVVDGTVVADASRTAIAETQTVSVPPGIGTHTVVIRPHVTAKTSRR